MTSNISHEISHHSDTNFLDGANADISGCGEENLTLKQVHEPSKDM